MHVVLRTMRRLPSSPPHIVIVESITYKFSHWHKETMVYEHQKTTIRIQTCKKGVKRYIRKILRSSDGRVIELIDGYRVRR
jgi:hypothetical protein